jgi:PmbA protein
MDEEKALDFLLTKVDEAELYSIQEISSRLVFKRGIFDVYEWNQVEGYGVRVIKDKRMGFAFSNDLDKEVLQRAVRTAGISEKDEYLSLPRRQKYKDFNTGYDERIRGMELEDALDFAQELIEACVRYNVNPSKAGISWSTGKERIINSRGVEVEGRETYCSCYITAVVNGKEAGTATEHAASRYLDLDFSSIGAEAARLARKSVGGQRLGGGVFDLVLKPDAVAELLEEVFAPSLSAENVLRKRSILGEHRGERLFTEELRVIDDGTLKGGLNTSAFDSEGVATNRTHLIDGGVLKGFLYDTYYANMAGGKSTGNATRSSHSALPGIGVSNLLIEGPKGIEGRDLVVHGLMGTHTANSVSGDFSVETRNAFYKERPVKNLIISGNVFDLLKNITGCGKDYKQVSSVITPSIEFSDVKVAG